MAQAVAANLRAAQQRARVGVRQPATTPENTFQPFSARDIDDGSFSGKQRDFLDRLDTSGELARLQREWLPQIREQVLSQQETGVNQSASRIAGRSRRQGNLSSVDPNRLRKGADGGPEGLDSDAGREAALKRVLAQKSLRGAKDQVKQEINEELKRRLRAYVKKQVKAGIQRIVQFVANLIGDLIGASIVGVIISALIWILTLGWWNVEMIYGTYIAKGKSKFIGPLSWDPFPIPLPVIVFEIAVICLDILVFVFVALLILILLLPIIIPTVLNFDTIQQVIGVNIF